MPSTEQNLKVGRLVAARAEEVYGGEYYGLIEAVAGYLKVKPETVTVTAMNVPNKIRIDTPAGLFSCHFQVPDLLPDKS